MCAVMTFARPCLVSTSSTAAGSKNAVSVGIPRAFAVLPTSVGSMPTTRLPAFWKFVRRVPSFDPMSTIRGREFDRHALLISFANSASLGCMCTIVSAIFAKSSRGGRLRLRRRPADDLRQRLQLGDRFP
jgi:hypothetical protein